MPTDTLTKWEGINQRTDTVLLGENIFPLNFGIILRDGSAARIEGKKLSIHLDGELIGIFQFDKIAILQTLNNLYSIPIDEL